jgi:hypothetical protein
MNQEPPPAAPERKRYVRAVGPRLRLVLYAVLGLFALLGANSAYLGSITFLQWFRQSSGEPVLLENYFYQFMFLAHLVLGLLLVVPVIVFGVLHIRNAHDRPNRRAVRVGYALFTVSLVLLFSGLALMRVAGFEIRNPGTRSAAYWAHVITPLLAVWLFILHRLAGPKIKWKLGLGWAWWWWRWSSCTHRIRARGTWPGRRRARNTSSRRWQRRPRATSSRRTR